MRTVTRRLAKFVIAMSGAALLLLLGLALIFPLPQDRLFPPASTLVLDNQGRLLRAFLAPDQMWRVRVTREEISPQLVEAVLTYEDRYFRWHPGVNPFALTRAAIANLRAGRVVEGGSTITMQVARMIEPKERTFANKAIEIFRALQLELRFSKDEILALYFNHAPYGGNIVGVGAAARAYFGKAPDQLSAGEAALLAAIPNSPNRYRPDLFPGAAETARNKVLALQRECGQISETVLMAARSEPVRARRHEMPFEAPHFADYLHTKFPSAERLKSTLDASIQGLAERALSEHAKELKRIGINNGAVVVIDNRTHSVLALVGSCAFDDTISGGQVNGALAPRSPGSALKPILYALALDRGVVSPRSLLFDVPVEFGGYKPVNYDEKYNGVVAVEDALVRSLNVPAINLAALVGGEEFYRTLKAGGLTTLGKPWELYGLPIVLGGCEVNLLELTNLYASLASSGVYYPYRLLDNDPLPAGKRLIGPESAFIITEMLAELRRPELPSVWDAATNIPKVAWKTGTSLGKRDAWSIGYNPEFTIGVWIGNFDGRGNQGLVGAEVAAPLLLTLIESLSISTHSRWFEQPPGVETRQVCALSGMVPSPNCAAVEPELYVPGLSPNQTCNIHQEILVDSQTGDRLCKHCRGNRKCSIRIVEQWPTSIATWMLRNGFAVDVIPPHAQSCPVIAGGGGPVIVSPAADAEFRLRSDVPRKYQKILLDVSVSNGTNTIYWFQDRKLVYSGDPRNQVFLDPIAGTHELICMDDLGRSSQVSVTIHD